MMLIVFFITGYDRSSIFCSIQKYFSNILYTFSAKENVIHRLVFVLQYRQIKSSVIEN
jgi:hypothetical protein